MGKKTKKKEDKSAASSKEDDNMKGERKRGFSSSTHDKTAKSLLMKNKIAGKKASYSSKDSKRKSALEVFSNLKKTEDVRRSSRNTSASGNLDVQGPLSKTVGHSDLKGRKPSHRNLSGDDLLPPKQPVTVTPEDNTTAGSSNKADSLKRPGKIEVEVVDIAEDSFARRSKRLSQNGSMDKRKSSLSSSVDRKLFRSTSGSWSIIETQTARSDVRKGVKLGQEAYETAEESRVPIESESNICDSLRDKATEKDGELREAAYCVEMPESCEEEINSLEIKDNLGHGNNLESDDLGEEYMETNPPDTGLSNMDTVHDRAFVLSGGDEVILVLKPGEEMCFQGKMRIQCIYGAVSIMGYMMRSDGEQYCVYSPQSTSLLSISATHHDNHLPWDKSLLNDLVKNVSQRHSNSKEVLENVLQVAQPSSTVLWLGHLKSTCLSFVCSFGHFQNLFVPKDIGNVNLSPLERIGVYPVDPEQMNVFNVTEDYEYAADKITGESPVVVICGGQNVGKSSLARYLINSTLNRYPEVAYLECDIGQTELTPPGCVALHLVSEPLLGPPFTHQWKAERMVYTGNLSPGGDPAHYLNCVKYVYSKFRSLQSKQPLFINTMGWIKGLGLMLLVDILRLVKPNVIIQLDSSTYTKNLPPVTTNFIQNTPGLDWTQEVGTESVSQHTLIAIQSPVIPGIEYRSKFRALDHRTMSLLSYLGQAQDKYGAVQSLNALQPLKKAWKDTAVHVCHSTVPNSQIMYALNASIVALCIVDTTKVLKPEEEDLPGFFLKMPICDCLGFGVVRSIDAVEKVFHIVTPLSELEMARVNCLLKGAVDIPQQVLMAQESRFHEKIPYIGESKDVIGAGSIKSRKHMLRRYSNKVHQRGDT